MIKRKDRLALVSDVEASHSTVADSIDDELGAGPLVVRLGDIWNDFVRAGESRGPESPEGSRPAVPLLDEMKGILQWD